MDGQDITIKGVREGLLIHLGHGDWEDRLLLLEDRLHVGATFFQGGRAAVDVGDRALTTDQIEAVRDLLMRHDIELWAVLSRQGDTVRSATQMGLAVDLGVAGEPTEEEDVGLSEKPGPNGLIVERTLRSGQKVHYPGHVVVLGDVNAGAEVIAGGHIVIWGKARGLIHAGALGDESAQVCALELAPTQLRIAGHIARSPDNQRRRPGPEMARVRDGKIEAVPWR
jgi:septum site-determining protein MinC